MGYSCTKAAADVHDAIFRGVRATCGEDRTSNGWTYNGVRYFDERGRENRDGAVTGTIWKYLPDGEHCRRVGGYKLDAGGGLVRFPGIPRAVRGVVRVLGARAYPLAPAESARAS